jgi:membrane peptidoglycan carboxypeptidase
VTGTGALADGKITTTERVVTRPFLTLGRGYRFWEWNRRGWGPLNIYDGFGHSSDTFFFQLAGRLGIDRLAYWAKQYGFGERTEIDLPAEARGTVPSNAWKEEVFGQSIFPGETYQAGIGQGYDTVTPIQLLNAYTALANGGKLYKPQIVRRILNPDGSVQRDFEPELIRDLPVDPGVLKTMRLAARRVVTIGHTYNLVDLPIVVAGKSGTAEFGLRDKKGRLPYHSWFAAFVPKKERKVPDDPNGTRAVAHAPDRTWRCSPSPTTRGPRATWRPRSSEYFLQIHLGQEGPRTRSAKRAADFYQGNWAVGTLRLEPTRVQAWAVRSAGAIWKAFDAQMVIYSAAAGHHRPADGAIRTRAARRSRRAPRSRAGWSGSRWPSSPSSSWPPSTIAG